MSVFGFDTFNLNRVFPTNKVSFFSEITGATNAPSNLGSASNRQAHKKWIHTIYKEPQGTHPYRILVDDNFMDDDGDDICKSRFMHYYATLDEAKDAVSTWVGWGSVCKTTNANHYWVLGDGFDSSDSSNGNGNATGMGVDPNNCNQANRVKNTDNSCGDCISNYTEDSDGNCISKGSGEVIGEGIIDNLTSPLGIGVGAIALLGMGYFMFLRKPKNNTKGK